MKIRLGRVVRAIHKAILNTCKTVTIKNRLPVDYLWIFFLQDIEMFIADNTDFFENFLSQSISI